MHWRVTPACLLVRLGLEGTRGGPWVPLPGASSLYIETGRNRTKAAAREQQLAHAYDMAEVTLERYPLVATAGLVWNTDLPRPLQQILFDTADGVGCAPLAQAS